MKQPGWWLRLPQTARWLLIGAVWVAFMLAFGAFTSWLCADNCPWSPRP